MEWVDLNWMFNGNIYYVWYLHILHFYFVGKFNICSLIFLPLKQPFHPFLGGRVGKCCLSKTPHDDAEMDAEQSLYTTGSTMKLNINAFYIHSSYAAIHLHCWIQLFELHPRLWCCMLLLVCRDLRVDYIILSDTDLAHSMDLFKVNIQY